MELVRTITTQLGQAYAASLAADDEILEMEDLALPIETAGESSSCAGSGCNRGARGHRRVLTISTMLGCSGTCSFCPVRKSFKRKLTARELVAQVDFLLEAGPVYGRPPASAAGQELQVLYSRMGEPSFNMPNVIASIYALTRRFSRIKIGLSTLGWEAGLAELFEHPELAAQLLLQFSAHGTDDYVRTMLLGLPTGRDLMTLPEIAAFTKEFRKLNPSKVALNFVLLKGVKYNFTGLRRYFGVEDIYLRLAPLSPDRSTAASGMEGLLPAGDSSGQYAAPSAELETVLLDIKRSGFTSAYAPAAVAALQYETACGQMLARLAA